MNPIEPKNLTARLAYRGRGNPPSSHPQDAIGNCFPGLEIDFRTLLRSLFVGVVLHEADGEVIAVDPAGPAAGKGLTPHHVLFTVDTIDLNGDTIDWVNVLGDILGKAGSQVKGVFISRLDNSTVELMLEVRALLDGVTIARDVAAPGDLTQSLCSPWQSDFRECACYYWAANRPDFIDVDIVNGQAQGYNWLHKDRATSAKKEYVPEPQGDQQPDPRLMSYEDLYRNWETLLRFQIGGRDET